MIQAFQARRPKLTSKWGVQTQAEVLKWSSDINNGREGEKKEAGECSSWVRTHTHITASKRIKDQKSHSPELLFQSLWDVELFIQEICNTIWNNSIDKMWSGTGPSLQQSSCQTGLGQLSSRRPFFSLKTTKSKILKYYACKTLWKYAVIVTKTSTDNASFDLLLVTVWIWKTHSSHWKLRQERVL